MEKYIDVIKRIIELINTIEEGIAYVNNQIEVLNYGEVSIVLRDIDEGIKAINESLSPILEQLPSNNIEIMTIRLKNRMEELIYFDNQNNMEEIMRIIDGEFRMLYKEWQSEIKEICNPYILS